ncbi:MAG: 50S ribosomal protein L11 methyltransferase [Clostridia bacterium]|nr:50S ribosomal protein L11 methyltransferase [Clostridia bacterium]
MDFIEAVIYTSTEGIEILTARLIMAGIQGFVIEDAEDFRDFLKETTPRWDYVDDELMRTMSDAESKVKLYLTNDAQGKAMLDTVSGEVRALKESDESGAYGRLEIELSNVREEDWDGNWKQYFKPFDVGRRFTVKPSWEECTLSDGRIILEIDPASSFGTGSHHTTKLCLMALEDTVSPGDRVLDMGCGTGILGIAAALLGAGEVTAVDIEEHSAKTALENAVKNGIPKERFTTYFGNILEDEALCRAIGGGYDVVAANIVADVIIAMRKRFFEFLKPGGTLIVSGLISQRADEVEQMLKNTGFAVIKKSSLSDWCAIVMEK